MIDAAVFNDARYGEQGNPLFGASWDAPRCDGAWFVEVPVGERCGDCGEPIEAGDRGEIMPLVTTGGVTAQPVHRECQLLSVCGHSYGVCRCSNYAGTGDRRAGALLLWRQVGALD